MVGLIHKVLLDLIAARGGPSAVAEVRRRAGVADDQRFRIDTVYADDEWQRLLAGACDVLGVSQEAAELAFADQFMKDAMARWPVWFEMSKTAREFLMRQQTIHNTFATGVRDPEARRGIIDKFRIEEHESELVVHYRSPNELCGLYRALAEWVLAHYRERAEITEPRCIKRGDAECELHLRWETA